MSHILLIKDSNQKSNSPGSNNNHSKSSAPVQDNVVKELSQVIGGRQRSQSVSLAVLLKKEEGKGKEIIELSSKKSDPSGKQEVKETESTKKYATLKFASPAEKISRPRAMSLFPTPEMLVSPQFNNVEVKRFSHSTASLLIKPEEFDKAFLRKTPIDQLKDIFSKPLNKEEKEQKEERVKKSRALIYVCDELFGVIRDEQNRPIAFKSKLSKDDQDKLFMELAKHWIFSEEKSKDKDHLKLVNYCIEILLEFSHAETAAPFLCELASKMEYKDLRQFATYLYSNHSVAQVFLRHTLELFTKYELPSQTVNSLNRESTLSTQLTTICLEIILSQELQNIIKFLNDTLAKHPENYYNKEKRCLTIEGLKLAGIFLDKIYAINLSNVEPYIKVRSNAIVDHFKKDPTVKVDELKKNCIKQMLFLSGINQYLVNHVKPKVKTDEERSSVVTPIIKKLTKLLQATANGCTLYDASSTWDTDLNDLIIKNQERHVKFVERFYPLLIMNKHEPTTTKTGTIY